MKSKKYLVRSICRSGLLNLNMPKRDHDWYCKLRTAQPLIRVSGNTDSAIGDIVAVATEASVREKEDLDWRSIYSFILP
jgi:hypothetical protein